MNVKEGLIWNKVELTFKYWEIIIIVIIIIIEYNYPAHDNKHPRRKVYAEDKGGEGPSEHYLHPVHTVVT